jgi:hypothetical protein
VLFLVSTPRSKSHKYVATQQRSNCLGLIPFPLLLSRHHRTSSRPCRAHGRASLASGPEPITVVSRHSLADRCYPVATDVQYARQTAEISSRKSRALWRRLNDLFANLRMPCPIGDAVYFVFHGTLANAIYPCWALSCKSMASDSLDSSNLAVTTCECFCFDQNSVNLSQ